MSLMQFINQPNQKMSPFNKLIVLACFLFFQACSTAPKIDVQDSTKDTNLDSLGKDIIGMVDIAENQFNLPVSIAAQTQISAQRSPYQAQEEQQLAKLPQSVVASYQHALTLMKDQQWQAAASKLDQIIDSQPQLSGAYVNQAIIALNQDDLFAANSRINKALAININNPYAHQVRGVIARLSGNMQQAEKSYIKAITLWPSYPQAHINLAILLELYRGRLLDARQYYLSYLKLQPDDEQAQLWLAGVELKIKRAGLSLPEPENAQTPLTATKNNLGES